MKDKRHQEPIEALINSGFDFVATVILSAVIAFAGLVGVIVYLCMRAS